MRQLAGCIRVDALIWVPAEGGLMEFGDTKLKMLLIPEH